MKQCGINVKEVGFRIKWLTHIYGETVSDVCDYLCLESVQAVYNWMAGKTFPTLQNLYLLSIHWRVSLDFLVTGKEHRNSFGGKYYLCCYEQMLWQAI